MKQSDAYMSCLTAQSNGRELSEPEAWHVAMVLLMAGPKRTTTIDSALSRWLVDKDGSAILSEYATDWWRWLVADYRALSPSLKLMADMLGTFLLNHGRQQ